MKSEIVQQVKELVEFARERNFKIEVRGTIVTVSKFFEPNSKYGYADFEMLGAAIIYDIPATRDRNVWGSTGDGIGGAVAMQRGHGALHLSGAKKTFLRELAKQTA